MFVTFDVLKLDTSIASKPHLLNMLLISFTFDVSKDETSIDARLLQPENISLIFVTFDVTKLFTFNDANLNKLKTLSLGEKYAFVGTEYGLAGTWANSDGNEFNSMAMPNNVADTYTRVS